MDAEEKRKREREREREREEGGEESAKKLAEDASLSRISEKPISNPIPGPQKGLTAFIAGCTSDAESTDVHTVSNARDAREPRERPLSLSLPLFYSFLSPPSSSLFAVECTLPRSGLHVARFAMQRLNGARPITVINCHCDIYRIYIYIYIYIYIHTCIYRIYACIYISYISHIYIHTCTTHIQ